MRISDETLMAYADGELPAAEAAAIAAALAADPKLAARVERFRGVRRALRTAYDSVVNEPVPDHLRALLHDVDVSTARSQPKIADFNLARALKRVSAPAWAAMAACAVGGVLIGRLAAPAPAGLFASEGGRLQAGAELTRVLDQRLADSTDNVDADLRVGFSFRSTDGDYCRTFTRSDDEGGVSGLACRQEEGWVVEIAASQAGQAGQYRQAGAAAPQVLEAVDAMIAGEPLDPGQEQAAREAGWR